MDPTRQSKAIIRASMRCSATCVDRFRGAGMICGRPIRLGRPRSISEEVVSSEEVTEEAHFAEEGPTEEEADFAERQDFVEFRIVAACSAALLGSAACRLTT